MEIIIVRHGTTFMNELGLGYDNFGKDEIYHLSEQGKTDAIRTGKYLATFGKFDKVFCSPRHRCLETFDLIKPSISYKNFEISKLVMESRQGILNGLDKDERDKIIAKNTKLSTLKHKFKAETNPFKKAKAHKKYIDERERYLKKTKISKIRQNYSKFLRKISREKCKRILVIGHGGTVNDIAQIVCNINYYDDILLAFGDKNQLIFNKGGCVMTGILYENKKFSLVIPPNNRQTLIE